MECLGIFYINILHINMILKNSFFYRNNKFCTMLYLFDDLWLDQFIPKNNDRSKKAEPYMEILRIRLIRFTG